MILIRKSSKELKQFSDEEALRKLFYATRSLFDTEKEFREFLKQIDMDYRTPMTDVDNRPQTKLVVRDTEFDSSHDVLSKPDTKTGTPQTNPKKQMKDPG